MRKISFLSVWGEEREGSLVYERKMGGGRGGAEGEGNVRL
jgi:hypothetical protein